eukprot:3619430-Rhodomonas_salina.1
MHALLSSRRAHEHARHVTLRPTQTAATSQACVCTHAAHARSYTHTPLVTSCMLLHAGPSRPSLAEPPCGHVMLATAHT